jgi:hypothetical protein
MSHRAWTLLVLILAACSPGGDKEKSASGLPDTMPGITPAINQSTSSSEWRIVPGDSAGPFHGGTSEKDLRLHFGAEAVENIRVELGEGETTPGTVLFPQDSVRRVEIIWQDTLQHRHPSRLVLRGNQSRWQVGPGITLGTTLQELEGLNGRPFTLAGFGWDYSGVVTDWGGGALDSTLTGIKLYLDPGQSQYNSPAYMQVQGDRDYSSSAPPMRQLGPRVTTIFVDFP